MVFIITHANVNGEALQLHTVYKEPYFFYYKSCKNLYHYQYKSCAYVWTGMQWDKIIIIIVATKLYQKEFHKFSAVGIAWWVLNHFKPLVDKHYKAVSHEFDVFWKFRISLNH